MARPTLGAQQDLAPPLPPVPERRCSAGLSVCRSDDPDWWRHKAQRKQGIERNGGNHGPHPRNETASRIALRTGIVTGWAKRRAPSLESHPGDPLQSGDPLHSGVLANPNQFDREHSPDLRRCQTKSVLGHYRPQDRGFQSLQAGHLQSPARHPRVASVLWGLGRLAGEPPRQVKTLREHESGPILSNYDRLATQPEHRAVAVRDAAVIAVGSTGAPRRSEICGLRLEDVEFLGGPGEANGMFLRVRRSKTGQFGRGQSIAIPEGAFIRPVERLRRWLAASRIGRGPVFQTPRTPRLGRTGTASQRASSAAVGGDAAARGHQNCNRTPARTRRLSWKAAGSVWRRSGLAP